ncbi:UDP-2,3-diacylglucosamine diphosphatase [uncultured Desulfuromonas sp.]|uniref:UDP-2,3-diacylglucosamine diphosphatase n=1 Tax=uncultured Desulfuromonas sp. TaxID=181013 RepID=UPI00263A0D65|nr:UDP-2,3-diacylglucosamine diphosphatase [uncultured Desulfuromonas sp.]
MKEKDLFIADAHLLDPGDANYRRLLTFLDEQRGRIRTLYLLGDIFDFWFGYRHTVFAPYVPILEALRRIREEGTEIVYVEGNHDFHMGPFFEQTLGCRILPDGGEVRIDDERIFIAHGDLVRPDDPGYRLLRRCLRSRPLNWLMRLIPPDWAWSVARWASRQSQKTHHVDRNKGQSEATLASFARQRFAEGYRAVVTGHFHSPMIRTSEEGTLVALGDWIDQFSYAVYEDGAFSLRSFKGAGSKTD